MAISIDAVYQRVLALANKEQRGYITPQEFNLLASKAQLDIFNQYFHDYKTAILNPGNQTKSSDDADLVREKTELHRVSGAILTSDANGSSYLPSTIHWLESVYRDDRVNRVLEIDMDIVDLNNLTTVGLLALTPASPGNAAVEGNYVIKFQFPASAIHPASYNNLIVSLTNGETSSTAAAKLALTVNTNSAYHTAVVVGSKVTITYQQDIDWSLTESVFEDGADITLINAGEKSQYVVYEEVKLEDSHYIRSNKKLNPTKSSRGIFYKYNKGSNITILPNPGVATLKCDYIKKPEIPGWGYVVVGEKALYNPSSSTDFELHPAEESNLTNKILELAGIVINKPGLSEVILRNQAVKEAKENK